METKELITQLEDKSRLIANKLNELSSEYYSCIKEIDKLRLEEVKDLKFKLVQVNHSLILVDDVIKVTEGFVLRGIVFTNNTFKTSEALHINSIKDVIIREDLSKDFLRINDLIAKLQHGTRNK